GAYALPLLLGETMLARAVLPQSMRPTGAIGLARGQCLSDGSVRCALVRGGRVARYVLVQTVESVWYLLPIDKAEISAHALALDVAMTWPVEQAATAAQPVIDADVWTLQACVV